MTKLIWSCWAYPDGMGGGGLEDALERRQQELRERSAARAASEAAAARRLRENQAHLERLRAAGRSFAERAQARGLDPDTLSVARRETVRGLLTTRERTVVTEHKVWTLTRHSAPTGGAYDHPSAGYYVALDGNVLKMPAEREARLRAVRLEEATLKQVDGLIEIMARRLIP
ncbi:MAG TPA: hypothetical protein VJT75_10380 [Thermoleophilaceae bacterium]|nr:hypothetical protein [Thermoleophilaceae bacterium]